MRHGTAYYRCHPCHLMKVIGSSKKTVQLDGVAQVENVEKHGGDANDDHDDDDDVPTHTEMNGNIEHNNDADDDDIDQSNGEHNGAGYDDENQNTEVNDH